jgi:hypothetical protein
MNARDRRFLNQAQTAVAAAGILVSVGVLPRSWKKSLAIAGATITLVLLLAD